MITVLDRGEYHPCKILDRRDGKIEVHYQGWKKRYDEWLEEDSPRILREETTLEERKRKRHDVSAEDVEAESSPGARKRLASDRDNIPLTCPVPSREEERETAPIANPDGGAFSTSQPMVSGEGQSGSNGSSLGDNAAQQTLYVPVVTASEVRPQGEVVGAGRHCSLCSEIITSSHVSC